MTIGTQNIHDQHHSSLTHFPKTLPGRLELPTLRLTASRSNQLSYGSRCIPKSPSLHQTSQAFIKQATNTFNHTRSNFRIKATARLAQSAERKALNLVVVGSSPTVGVFCLTREARPEGPSLEREREREGRRPPGVRGGRWGSSSEEVKIPRSKVFCPKGAIFVRTRKNEKQKFSFQ